MNLIVQGPGLTQAHVDELAHLLKRTAEPVADRASRFRNSMPDKSIASWCEERRIDHAFVIFNYGIFPQIETSLEPRALLSGLLAIERAHGRRRGLPNGPRTLDLDLLLYGERTLREPGLTIPHPRMPARAFVLVPLAEIAPDVVVPGRGPVADLVRNVVASVMIKLPEK